jgi:anti-sigma regulatory factor (Ser/Thr protein kinase)
MSTKQMPARMESLRDLTAFIAARAAETGLSKDTQHRVELVMEEVLVNVIRHAYPSDSGDIELRFTAGEGPELTIEITDTGIPFDPLQKIAPDVGADLDERKVGGLGVLLIQRMTDRLAYRRDHNRNKLTLTFFNR